MSSDVFVLVVGVALAVVVVGLGLRRDLSEVTRSWLPQFGKDPESMKATPQLLASGQTRRQLSPGQRKFVICFNLVMCFCYLAFAVLSANNRWWNVSLAVLFAISAAVEMRRARTAVE